MIRITNGNTIESEIDLGFGLSLKMNIKLFGVDDTEEAKTFLIKNLPREFVCRTNYTKRGKAGRVLGEVFVPDEQGNLLNINELMIKQGFAKT